MLWYHWVALIGAILAFITWVGIKFGVDVSDILLLPIVFLLD